MSYYGDLRLGDTLDFDFTTVGTTGAPTTLAGSPVLSAYVGNSTTEITAGITLTVDFDSRTGLNHVRVVASGGNGFAAATNVRIVITTGTVGGTSVVGYVVGSFSIENRSALMPSTAGRTLVVDAAGLADANMVKAGPSGSGAAVPAGAIPNAVAGAAGGLFIAGSNAALTIASITCTGTFSIGGTSNVAQTGDSYARLGAPAGASVSADIGVIPTAIEIADAYLDRDMSAGTDSGSPTVRTPRQALRILRNRWAISGTTQSIKKEDDSTESWSQELGTTAGADPVTSTDPA